MPDSPQVLRYSNVMHALARARRFGSALLGSALLLAGPAAAQEEMSTVSGKANVLRGDLLEIVGTTTEGVQEIRQTQRVRLYGVAAPFLAQKCHTRDNAIYPCGKYARNRLSKLIGGDSVTCVILDRDSYGRRIGICRTEDWNLNEAMIVFGWAMAYRGLSNNYVLLEQAAKGDNRGFWSGTIEPPWNWHARNPDKVKFPKDIDRPDKIRPDNNAER